jgi:hypothetical protein
MAVMHDYLAKAHENLAGAESELQHGRTNSCARSAYYACFHAAITALLHVGLTAPEPARGWSHDWVHASFVGQADPTPQALFVESTPDLAGFAGPPP